MTETLLPIVQKINGYLSDYILVALLIAVGLWYSIKTRFVQVRHFKEGWNSVFGSLSLRGGKQESGMSSFQALATAIAAQVGTGNIVGASGAILTGGPGAIFWMWVIAFLGMATIYAEATLAQETRTVDKDGNVLGGPVYYITTAFKGGFGKFLAGFFAVAIILALGFFGCMVQSNSISSAFATSFGLPSWVIGLIVALLTAVILLGGIGRIASFTEKVVPVMAVLYLAGSIVVLGMNYTRILPALGSIFTCAFHPAAAFGGVGGYTVMKSVKYGVARGLFSNEAGMGSTPHAHAVATVSRPEKQGHVAIVSVFFDTFVVLTITALVILTSGVLPERIAPDAGIDVTQAAFSASFGAAGGPFIAVCLMFFAFSTIISWYYYGETNVRYLFRRKSAVTVYKLLVVVFVFLGSLFQADAVWALADVCNGLMVIPNLAALLLLCPVVFAMHREDRKN